MPPIIIRRIGQSPLVERRLTNGDDATGLENDIAHAYEFLERAELAAERLRMLTLRPAPYLSVDTFESMAELAKSIMQMAAENGATALFSAAASTESVARLAAREGPHDWPCARDQLDDYVGIMEALIAAARRELGIGGR